LNKQMSLVSPEEPEEEKEELIDLQHYLDRPID
jgi:hypothetical protein